VNGSLARDPREYRLIMAAITMVCGVAVLSGVFPVLEHIVGGALVAVLLGTVAVRVVRRERRIRRRLADTSHTRVLQRGGSQ
jgi:Flp pilus assembly protein TadB